MNRIPTYLNIDDTNITDSTYRLVVRDVRGFKIVRVQTVQQQFWLPISAKNPGLKNFSVKTGYTITLLSKETDIQSSWKSITDLSTNNIHLLMCDIRRKCIYLAILPKHCIAFFYI